MKKNLINAGSLEVHVKNCEFCGDDLPLNSHKARKFCPSKFGINEYCKYHKKQLIEHERIVGLKPVVTIKDIEKDDPPNIIQDIVDVNDSIGTVITKRITQSIDGKAININIIERLLQGKDETLVDIDFLVSSGYDFSVYDAKLPFPKTELFYSELEDYAIVWYSKNKILITKAKEIICLH